MTAAPSNPETQLTAGAWLDRYELLAPVATGGFGAVWLGRLRGKRGFEKLVAIKVPRLNGDVSFQEMLLDEARIASAIDHEYVAKIIELGEQGEILYIVMEWIDGEPASTLLRALDRTKTPMPVAVALKIIGDMCAATHAAHELRGADGTLLGVVHRDISPQNMLVTAAGSVKLIDFGIAKARDRASGDTTDGTLKGKIKYMAPEQALGREVDRRTDVFALGAVLYRFLAGHAPYEAENEVATIHKLATGTPAPPLAESFPLSVRNLVARSLSLDPAARFKTAADMHAAILEAMQAPGLGGDKAQVAQFIEIHLADRLSKRRAAIELALKAAADRNANTGAAAASVSDVFPAPLSSRDGSGSVGRVSEHGGPASGTSGSSAQNYSTSTPPTESSSGISHLSASQMPVTPPASRLKLLWALALLVGVVGIAMIAFVATRSKPVAPASASSAVVTTSPPPEVSSAPPPLVVLAPAMSSASSAPAAPNPKPVGAAPRPYVWPKVKPRPTAGKPASSGPDFGY